MIYQSVNEDEPIRQGDIFRSIPHLELSLSELTVVDDDHSESTTWETVVESSGISPVTALVAVEPVFGIVITQDCDAVRGRDVCLAHVDEFLGVTGRKESAPKTPKKWQSLLTTQMKENLRYFYLPADQQLGFVERMAADFRFIIRVPREDLLTLRHYRLGRLNDVATQHFRESLGQFYRRYPYNEWYPLTKEEVQEYVKDCPEKVTLYDWQK